MADELKRFLTADSSWKWSTAEITFNDFFKSEGIQFLRMETGAAVYEIVFGTYRFDSSMPPSQRGAEP